MLIMCICFFIAVTIFLLSYSETIFPFLGEPPSLAQVMIHTAIMGLMASALIMIPLIVNAPDTSTIDRAISVSGELL